MQNSNWRNWKWHVYDKICLHVFNVMTKCLNFNPGFAFRAKLVWINHQHKYKKSKFVDVCPCLNAIDEETLIRLMRKQITRDQLIDIDIRKWLVKLENKNIYTVKSERKG